MRAGISREHLQPSAWGRYGADSRRWGTVCPLGTLGPHWPSAWHVSPPHATVQAGSQESVPSPHSPAASTNSSIFPPCHLQGASSDPTWGASSCGGVGALAQGRVFVPRGWGRACPRGRVPRGVMHRVLQDLRGSGSHRTIPPPLPPKVKSWPRKRTLLLLQPLLTSGSQASPPSPGLRFPLSQEGLEEELPKRAPPQRIQAAPTFWRV